MAKIQLILQASPISPLSRGESSSIDSSIDVINQHADKYFNIITQRSYDFSIASDVKTELISQEFAPDQIVVIELTDGGILYLRLDEMLELSGNAGKKIVQITSSSPIGGISDNVESRGLVKDLIKTISFPEIKWSDSFKKDGAELSSQAIARYFQQHLQDGKEGLLKWNHLLNKWERREEPTHVIPLSPQPLLIFIHGTASSTAGTFSDLWLNEDGSVLKSRQEFADTYYAERIYAFEHDTLTKTPARNAINLLKELSKGQSVHLVTHSRGGLVGELLALSSIKDAEPIAPADIDRFTSAYEKDVPPSILNDLEQLNKKLLEKSPVIERFVRVACPVRGTTLAAGRLDIYLSVLATAAQFLMTLGNPSIANTVSVLKGFAIAAAKKRMQLAELPGLESMMPESGFIRLLNDHPSQVDSKLTVIAGNAQADGLSWQTLMVAFSNVYYWKKNDFVVESDSMLGGLRRKDEISIYLDADRNVSHFSYFQNQKTVNRIYTALIRDEEVAKSSRSDHYEKIALTKPIGLTIVIPTFAASHLKVGDQRVWIQPDNLAKGRFTELDLTANPYCNPDGWFDSRYQGFCNHLEEHYKQRIISFAYDWRLSTVDNAKNFSELIEMALTYHEYANLPVRIVAHSTGGYIALQALKKHMGLRRKLINHHDLQVFLLGTPFNGSFHTLEVSNGVTPLLPYLEMMDGHHKQQDFKTLFESFPGWIDGLPKGYEGANVKLHEELIDKPVYSNRIFYIAGDHPRTPVAKISNAEFKTANSGDGVARWDQLPEWLTREQIWYMPNTRNGDLLATADKFSALAELVTTGNTYQLTHTRPISDSSRGLRHKKLHPEKSALLYPGIADLENTALKGSSKAAQERSAETQCAHTRIVHGDLRNLDHPIVVGHYLQDGIMSAEAAIDDKLDGWLSQLHRKNLYPGEIESAEVFTRKGLNAYAFGAVVVGLGAIGSLTVPKLRRTLKKGFIKFGLHQHELRNNCVHTDQPVPIALSSLLIGVGSGGISIDDSVLSLLRAVSEANQVLVDMECDPIARLDIVELFEDVAISAAKSLHKISQQLPCGISFEPLIISINGGQKRASSMERQSWWQHIQILGDDEGSLAFSPLTNRAGMDTKLLQTQVPLIEKMIEHSTRDTRFNRDFSESLFKLLIPGGLKEQVLDENGMVLLLNKEAATHPWEMLVPGNEINEGREPIATQIGLIRKLHTEVDQTQQAVINNKAMIIGDPVSELPELKGAQEEARRVQHILAESVFETAGNTIIKSSGANIISKVMNTSVQILHLAGHGIYLEPGQIYQGTTYKKGLAGMVLGDGIFLTEHEVNQLDAIPELIFINCCHLGKVNADDFTDQSNLHSYFIDSRSGLAANLGTSFIQAGAKCVVAAGWEVDDGAALTFASTFYEKMIHHGENFGKACLQARIAVYKKHPHTNTWGAYQCYGDPLFRFNNRSSKKRAKAETSYKTFHCVSELLIWSQNICSDAYLSKTWKKQLAKETHYRVEKLPVEWSSNASVHEAIANVFARIDEDVRAIAWYQSAIECKDSTVTIRGLEQRVELLIKLSEQMFAFYSKFSTMDTFDDQYAKQALDSINNLLELGRNRKRELIKARIHKHYGQTYLESELRKAKQHIEEAYELYQASSKEAEESSGRYDVESLLNAALTWLGLRRLYSENSNRRYLRELKQLKAQLENPANKVNFDSREALLRCILLLRFSRYRKDKKPIVLDDLQKLYFKLLENASDQQIEQALAPIQFLHDYLSKTWNKKDHAQVQRIKVLKDELAFMYKQLDSSANDYS